MNWDFSTPTFPKRKTGTLRYLRVWQSDLERLRIQFGRVLHSIPRLNVRCLEWSASRGCVDIVFNNGYHKAVPVESDSGKAFMQDILAKLN